MSVDSIATMVAGPKLGELAVEAGLLMSARQGGTSLPVWQLPPEEGVDIVGWWGVPPMGEMGDAPLGQREGGQEEREAHYLSGAARPRTVVTRRQQEVLAAGAAGREAVSFTAAAGVGDIMGVGEGLNLELAVVGPV